MSRTAQECVRHGCQHPEDCAQTRCWIVEEQNEFEPAPPRDEAEDQRRSDYRARAKDSR